MTVEGNEGMDETALIEASGTLTMEGRATRARALVEALEEDAVVAVREGRPVDAAALAQARADAEATAGALAAEVREERARQAAAERERRAGIKRQVGVEMEALLTAVDEAEAASLAMVEAIERANASNAKIRGLFTQIGQSAPLALGSADGIFADALTNLLRRLARGGHYGSLVLLGGDFHAGKPWRERFGYAASEVAAIIERDDE